MLSGGRNVAIILLLKGKDAMTALSQLQIRQDFTTQESPGLPQRMMLTPDQGTRRFPPPSRTTRFSPRAAVLSLFNETTVLSNDCP